ncbi:MAG: metallophosphoesterase family protein [Pseudomonadota bacterium]
MSATAAKTALLPSLSPFEGAPEAPEGGFSVPPGVRVYAVGDIHGHLGLLRRLQGMIDTDIAAHSPANIIEVYLGDYIDRGPDSCGVIDHLSRPRPHRTVFLRGNHEDYPERFLNGDDVLEMWLHNGGIETLASYGLSVGRMTRPSALRRAFSAALPSTHLTFLKNLKLAYHLGDVFFVHAGIRPGVPLSAQSRDDLLLIRREFIEHSPALPVRVVHGHTPRREPDVTRFRVGIDTGAFATGRLTCAVLEGPDVRFLHTGD